MAAVQPHAAPRRHPAPAPPPAPAPSQAPQPPCKRGRADTVAVAHGQYGRKQERVAESCCPSEREREREREREQELVLLDDDSGDEDGGCGSFVGGVGGGQDDEDEGEGNGSAVVWWRRKEGNCSLWASAGERDGDEDPKVAAARRQEEDRKFWEACLASGYP